MENRTAANFVHAWLLAEKGKNEIIVLDLLGPEKATVSGLKKPILDMLRAEAPATHRAKGQNLNLKGESPVAVGELSAGNGWQEVKFGKTVAGRYFCLEALSAQDGKDNAAVAEFYLLDEMVSRFPVSIGRLNMLIVKAQVGATLLPIKYMICRNLPIGALVMEINILTSL